MSGTISVHSRSFLENQDLYPPIHCDGLGIDRRQCDPTLGRPSSDQNYIQGLPVRPMFSRAYGEPGMLSSDRLSLHNRGISGKQSVEVLGDKTNTRIFQEPQSFPRGADAVATSPKRHSSWPAAIDRTSCGHLGDAAGGLVGDAKSTSFQSLGLERVGIQPTRNIVPIPVPPAARAGQSPLGGGSLAYNGELLKFIMPSGPRKNGEGVEDHHQGIVSTMVVNESAILVQLTLLVAGFVIGPSGESVRSIIAKTGASIYSYTEVVETKKSRLFYIEGPVQSVISALQIICAAVTRYKNLAEGQCSGHQVERKQNIHGVDFCYQPPPRSVVPYAAGLKISKESSDTYAIAANSHLLSSRFGCI